MPAPIGLLPRSGGTSFDGNHKGRLQPGLRPQSDKGKTLYIFYLDVCAGQDEGYLDVEELSIVVVMDRSLPGGL